MTDRNLYIRAAEGDVDAEREVLKRLRRKHTASVEELRIELCNRLMRRAATIYQATEALHSDAWRALEDALLARGFTPMAALDVVRRAKTIEIMVHLNVHPMPGETVYGALMRRSPNDQPWYLSAAQGDVLAAWTDENGR